MKEHLNFVSWITDLLTAWMYFIMNIFRTFPQAKILFRSYLFLLNKPPLNYFSSNSYPVFYFVHSKYFVLSTFQIFIQQFIYMYTYNPSPILSLRFGSVLLHCSGNRTVEEKLQYNTNSQNTKVYKFANKCIITIKEPYFDMLNG